MNPKERAGRALKYIRDGEPNITHWEAEEFVANEIREATAALRTKAEDNLKAWKKQYSAGPPPETGVDLNAYARSMIDGAIKIVQDQN